jgi:aminopeptidase N
MRVGIIRTAVLLLGVLTLSSESRATENAQCGIVAENVIQSFSVRHPSFAAKENWQERKAALLRYANYPAADEIVLRTACAESAAADKARMVLHQLRLLAGAEAFERIMRDVHERVRSERVSWQEIEKSSAQALGKNSSWFFRQWIDLPGLPELSLDAATVRASGSRYAVTLDVTQQGDIYDLDAEIAIELTNGREKIQHVRLDAEKNHVVLLVDEEPLAVTIDRNYDIPRVLEQDEVPPLLGALDDDEPLIVAPLRDPDRYASVIAAWKARGGAVKSSDAVGESDLRDSSAVVFGADNPVWRRLFGGPGTRAGEASLQARKNPWNPDKTVLLVQAKTAAAADAALPDTVAANGAYSAIAIDEAGAVTKSLARSERGIEVELRKEPAAVDVAALSTLTRVIEKTAESRIVYVGEYHDRFAHHAVELRTIKLVHRRNPKIAIGMEMFQQPFQPVLDEYIAGTIDERTFLKKSEYFKRWSYDYNLYKPILDYARENGIPVVALNQRTEITDKVSRQGLDALDEKERAQIPADLDFSDDDYRDRLQQAFNQHPENGQRKFAWFLQAQVLWDETMASSIDGYLRRNPDRSMVVIAGLGHLAYKTGIPKRAFRRNSLPYSSILSDADVEEGIADYLVFPQELEGTPAQRLMVSLKESGGSVFVTDMPQDSIARAAGIRTGDAIAAIDNEAVSGADDVKIAMFFKHAGDSVSVRVVRTRFLFGPVIKEILVKL